MISPDNSGVSHSAALAPEEPHASPALLFRTIRKIVADHFGLNVADLDGKSRRRMFAFPRHLAMYLCKKYVVCSLNDVGIGFGGRDHSTVLKAIQNVEGAREASPAVRRNLEALERAVVAWRPPAPPSAGAAA